MVVLVVDTQCLVLIVRIEQLVALVAVVLVGVCSNLEHKGFALCRTGAEAAFCAVGQEVAPLAHQDYAAFLVENGPQVAFGHIGGVVGLLAGGYKPCAGIVDTDLAHRGIVEVDGRFADRGGLGHFRKPHLVGSVVGTPVLQIGTVVGIQVLLACRIGVTQLPEAPVGTFAVLHYAQ